MTPRIGLAALFLFVLNLALNWRILLPGVTPYRGSIERGYAYMAWIFSRNPDYLSWNPLQYCGIPMHYVYLPLLPYFESLFLWTLPNPNPTYIHRTICGVVLFASPAIAYVFIRLWHGRTKWAMFSALAITFVSPLYWIIDTIDRDRGFMQVPWRIQVLIKYGEGPHTVGIFFFFLALILVRRAAQQPGFPALLAAALSLAATVLTNWVAGLALAFAVCMLLLVHLGDKTFQHRRVFQAGILGYLLAAFWLTPGFIAQMALNWPKDAFGYQFKQLEQTSLIAWAAGLILLRLAFWKFPQHRYLCFVLLCCFGYGLPVMLFYRYGINAFPEARRYALEFEMFLLLLAIELWRLLYSVENKWFRRVTNLATLAALLVLTPHVTRYVKHHYEKWVLTDRENTAEYRVSMALQNLNPQGRVFVTGGTRFRMNSWVLLPQTGGVFETGLKVRLPVDAGYHIITDLGLEHGRELEQSVMLLRALAVEYVVVHGPDSEEFYKDFKNPRKFDGHLEKVWEESGDAIYRVTPVRYAHLLTPDEVPKIGVHSGYQKPWYPYIAGMLDTSRPQLTFRWDHARQATVLGTMKAGMHVAFAIPWDPNWRAYSNGKPVELVKGTTGFLTTGRLAETVETQHLRFEPAFEEIAGAGVSLATVAFCGFLLLRHKRQHKG